MERTEQIDVDNAFPFVVGNRFEHVAAAAVVVAPNTCVVDENIDFTEISKD